MPKEEEEDDEDEDSESGEEEGTDEDIAFVVERDNDEEEEDELKAYMSQVREQTQTFDHHIKNFIQLLVVQIISPNTDWFEVDSSYKYSHVKVHQELKLLVR